MRKRLVPELCCVFFMMPATQNMIKYTHIEIMWLLSNTTYCFFVYVFEQPELSLLTDPKYTPQSLIPEIAFGTYLRLRDHATS